MSVSIVQRLGGTGCSAFIDDDHSCKCVMVVNEPVVAWGFNIKQLEDWIATLEQQLEAVSGPTWYSLHRLLSSLRAAHDRHLLEHRQVVSEAPTADDLTAYLAAYAAAVATEAA